MTDMHEQYMRQALALAARGVGEVEPNPAVGCVIVRDGHIIGEGWHRRFGGPHAEIEALADCRAKGHDPAGATLYVTLEPCCHTGKTGPCSEAVIAAGVQQVIIASGDPTRLAGGGMNEIVAAGIDVQIGVCRDEAEALNAPFYKHARTGQPWVILKWAQSIDGKLAWKNPPAEGPWISNAQSRQDVHRLRKRVQAIVTGISTVLADNPKLTVRIDGCAVERPPLRVVLDSHLQLPWDCRLITVPEAPTMIVTTQHTAQVEFQQVEKFRNAGVEVLAVRETDHRCDLAEMLAALGQRGVQQVLIEAGPTLLAEFLRQNLADEVRIYIAPLLLGANGHADISEPLVALAAACKLNGVQVHNFGGDVCFSAHIGSFLD